MSRSKKGGMVVTSNVLVERLTQKPKLERALVRAEGAAIASVLSDYGTGKLGTYQVKRRFTAQAWGEYRFSKRTAAYSRRTARSWGGSKPNVSPDRPGLAAAKIVKLTAMAAQGNVAGVAFQLAAELAAAKPKTHARDRVNKPGIGHQVKMSTQGGKASARMTFPAMRALNRHPRYAREFRGFSSNPERRFLVGLMKYRSASAIAAVFAAQQTTSKRSRKAKK